MRQLEHHLLSKSQFRLVSVVQFSAALASLASVNFCQGAVRAEHFAFVCAPSSKLYGQFITYIGMQGDKSLEAEIAKSVVCLVQYAFDKLELVD